MNKIIVPLITVVLFLAMVFIYQDYLVKTSPEQAQIKYRLAPERDGPCAGAKWREKGFKNKNECKYPHPPEGRWHAVYTADFAEKYDLPMENVSNDLSSGVDYAEMETVRFGERAIACMVNMLVQKPHDIAFYNRRENRSSEPDFSPFPERTHIHLIDLGISEDDLERMTTFSSVSRDYDQETTGFRSTTPAFYVEDVLPRYDYITAEASCRGISMGGERYYPNGYALWAAKASILGKYEPKYKYYHQPERPKGQDFVNANQFINIPKELIIEIFKDVPVGGIYYD